jgi:hypothetical protein
MFLFFYRTLSLPICFGPSSRDTGVIRGYIVFCSGLSPSLLIPISVTPQWLFVLLMEMGLP